MRKQCGNGEAVRLLQGSMVMMLVAWMAGGMGVVRRDQNEGRTRTKVDGWMMEPLV